MNKTGLIAAPLLALLALAGPAHGAAQEAAATAATTPAVDEEEALDEAIKRFGYLSGLALTCVAEGQKAELEREVLNVNNSITRLLGVDRAFLFSSSFGYGTSVEVKAEECAEVLKSYAARVARHRAAAGGAL